MIKQCQRCGSAFETKGYNAKWCSACRVFYQRERNRRHYQLNKEKYDARARQWQKEHPERKRAISKKYRESHKAEIRERFSRWLENHPGYKKRWDKKRKQIAQLRAKLKAAAVKRQAELERQQKYYQNPPSMFDGFGIPIPSCLANLGMP